MHSLKRQPEWMQSEPRSRPGAHRRGPLNATQRRPAARRPTPVIASLTVPGLRVGPRHKSQGARQPAIEWQAPLPRHQGASEWVHDHRPMAPRSFPLIDEHRSGGAQAPREGWPLSTGGLRGASDCTTAIAPRAPGRLGARIDGARPSPAGSKTKIRATNDFSQPSTPY